MTIDPFLGFKRDVYKSLEVMQTETGAVAPGAGLIFKRSEKVVVKNGPFSLSQIVALILRQRSA